MQCSNNNIYYLFGSSSCIVTRRSARQVTSSISLSPSAATSIDTRADRCRRRGSSSVGVERRTARKVAPRRRSGSGLVAVGANHSVCHRQRGPAWSRCPAARTGPMHLRQKLGTRSQRRRRESCFRREFRHVVELTRSSSSVSQSVDRRQSIVSPLPISCLLFLSLNLTHLSAAVLEDCVTLNSTYSTLNARSHSSKTLQQFGTASFDVSRRRLVGDAASVPRQEQGARRARRRTGRSRRRGRRGGRQVEEQDGRDRRRVENDERSGRG